MDGGVFHIEGASDCAAFAVYAGEGDVPPLLGSCTAKDGGLTFRPRYGLAPGIRVRAVYRPSGGAAAESVFEVAKVPPPEATTLVRNVYPSAQLVPENELKFYIYFTAPMQRGDAWRHIHLVREDGKIVELPFLELDQELWDRDNTRLTILFDPGRIKRGVLPLVEVGPAIEAGKSYTLVIGREWLDGRGAPLAEEFRKPFRVGPADRDPVDPAKWRVTAPRAGTGDAVVVRFPEPLDYALLQHLLTVTGPGGSLTGRIEVGRDETEWRFIPEKPWKAGDYRILVPTTLEDLAGNHVGRAFDVDTFAPITTKVQKDTVAVGFRVARH
jgi:hypothetical protein